MFRFDSLKVKAVSDISIAKANMSSSAAAVPKAGEAGYRGTIPNDPAYMKRVVEMQRLFLKNDGKLVWQKRGMRDLPLYYALIGISVVGLTGTFYEIYKMAHKKN